jgi:hypothetical protein
MPKPTLTSSLNLPPLIQNRPTIIALITTIAFTMFPDTIIKASVEIVRATREDN